MATAARDLWEAAFGRLRIALVGDLASADILAQSRERVQKARETLERTALQPRSRPFAQFASPSTSEPDGQARNYFVLILDAHGVVSTHKLIARDDDEATAQAQIEADERAFDVWDGWRFMGHFEPPVALLRAAGDPAILGCVIPKRS